MGRLRLIKLLYSGCLHVPLLLTRRVFVSLVVIDRCTKALVHSTPDDSRVIAPRSGSAALAAAPNK